LVAIADGFDFQKWIACLKVNTSTSNHVFGTKLIDHFAKKLSKQLSHSDIHFLQQSSNNKLIYLSRNDKAEQAVSTYIARKSKLFFTPTQDDKYKRIEFLKTLEYDFDTLYNYYQKGIKAEATLALFIQTLGLPVLEVSYENLIEQRAQTIQTIFSFLNISPSDDFVIPEPETQPVSDKHCQPIRQQFAADLAVMQADSG
jgi:LPS sulfotransferase NodH